MDVAARTDRDAGRGRGASLFLGDLGDRGEGTR
jgi:hypothetical protein